MGIEASGCSLWLVFLPFLFSFLSLVSSWLHHTPPRFLRKSKLQQQWQWRKNENSIRGLWQERGSCSSSDMFRHASRMVKVWQNVECWESLGCSRNPWTKFYDVLWLLGGQCAGDPAIKIQPTEGVPAVSWSSDMGLLGMGGPRDVNCIFGFHRGFMFLVFWGSDFIATYWILNNII